MRRCVTEAERMQVAGEKTCDLGRIKKGAPRSEMVFQIRTGF